jgi:hypothetical protein
LLGQVWGAVPHVPSGSRPIWRAPTRASNGLPCYGAAVRTKRTPDMLIPNEWAIEFKIARPYGDNGKEAENWSVNLLHPYKGNVSTVGDCYKLREFPGPERKAIVVIGYEHASPRISLTPLVKSFEVIAREVAGICLSPRVEIRIEGLIHPIHQSARIFSWQVQGEIHEDVPKRRQTSQDKRGARLRMGQGPGDGLVEEITPENKYAEVDWGEEVGREKVVWKAPRPPRTRRRPSQP